jgi:acid stress-induced BolA-like protein IbaG/YrbA
MNAAAMNAETIRQLIEQGLPGARAHVQGDDGVHFEALVICECMPPSAA